MKTHSVFVICTFYLACTTSKTEQQSYVHLSSELLSNTNQTCSIDQHVFEKLQNAYTALNRLTDEINTLNQATIAISAAALIALYLYIPLLYTTYKQISVAEKRINQFATGR